MGYYSKVAYVVQGPVEYVTTLMVEFRMAHPEHYKTIEEENSFKYWNGDESVSVAFTNENIKWYDNYESVQAHECFFSFSRERDESHELFGAFVRIGEDSNDIEERYFGDNPYDLVRPIRTVEIHPGYLNGQENLSAVFEAAKRALLHNDGAGSVATDQVPDNAAGKTEVVTDVCSNSQAG